MVDHGVIGDAELAADLLAVQMVPDQPQDLAFTLGECRQSLLPVRAFPSHPDTQSPHQGGGSTTGSTGSPYRPPVETIP